MKDIMIGTCPHCGNRTPQRILFLQAEDGIIGEGHPLYEEHVRDNSILLKCSTCEGLSLYRNWEFYDEVKELDESELLYPPLVKLNETVPAEIRNSYGEAIKIKKLTPSGFAVLIRRTLEYLCNEQKAEGRSLREKITYMGKEGIIPKTLSLMADKIRIIGNIGAHASSIKIDSKEAEIIDDFLIAMVEYVYIAPYKIRGLAKALEEKKKG